MEKAVSPDACHPRRHCMIVYACYPLGETRVQREAEALVDRGYEVDVICIRIHGESAEATYQGVRIYRDFPLPKDIGGGMGERFLRYLRFFVLAAVRVARLHKERPYSTVQVHNLPDFLVFCALIPKLREVPVILDLHDLMPEFFAGRVAQDGGSLINRLLALLIRWQEQLSCRFADHVITVSEHWRQALIKRGVPAHKCSVVMNVADGNIFHPTEAGGYHLPDGSGFRMIYHGTIVYRYGLDLAVQAVARLRHDIPGIHLTILGYGEQVDTLMRMVKQMDLHDHVTILRELRLAGELPALIRTAHLGIVPYRNDVFTDGLLPTKLMEYAALGVPAIAARTTAIESHFRDTMVEFFEPGDVDDLALCIRRLYGNPRRLAELAKGSEKFNQQYSWAEIGAAYADLVEGLGKR
jgi:glycosyltransferase involved in cell wall biosynthesis